MSKDFINLKPPMFGALETEELRRELGNFFLDHRQQLPNANVKELEQRWCETFDVKYAIACASDDLAFAVCLAVNGIRDTGGLVSSLTRHASLNASTLFQNTLFFTDIAGKSSLPRLSMSPQTFKQRLDVSGFQIEYFVANHLFGYPAPTWVLRKEMEAFLGKNTEDEEYFFIEDCLDATGSSIVDKYVGTQGDMSVFSLSPSDTIHCGGEGAMICTNNEEMALRAELFTTKGIGENVSLQPDQLIWGLNICMNEVQATIALKSMENWKERQEKRKEIQRFYFEELVQFEISKIGLPFQPVGYNPNWSHFTIQIKHGERNNLQLWLLHHGVEATPYLYRPLHKQPAYQTPDVLDNVEAIIPTLLNIPCHSRLTNDEMDHIVELIKTYFKGGPEVDKFKQNRPQKST